MRVAWFSLESLTATLGRAKVDGSVSGFDELLARLANEAEEQDRARAGPHRLFIGRVPGNAVSA